MSKKNFVFCLFGLFIVCNSFSQNFILQESNLDPKKNSQFFVIAKRCESVLLKKEEISSLQFSSKSTLTNNYLRDLCNKFPQLRPAGDYEKVIKRDFKSATDKIIKFTYTFVPPDKNNTAKYVQLYIQFDKESASPKIVDLQLKTPADVGIITLSNQEVDKLRKKPEPPAPEKKTTKPAPTKKTPSKPAPTKKTQSSPAPAKKTPSNPAPTKKTPSKPVPKTVPKKT